jgi:PAS domain S-box-containing protein
VKLLVIDDNAELARNLVEIFFAEGYQVESAEDASAGLRLAQAGFDLALLDVRLPDTPGTTLLAQLKARAPDAEVIVMTANADLTSAIDSFKGGAFAYLSKPVVTEKLILTVARARERIEMRRRERELQAALESSEKTHREIVESVQALILGVDDDFVVRYANRATLEVIGYAPGELIGRDLRELLDLASAGPGERSAVLEEALESGSQILEQPLLHKDGSSRQIVWRWTRRIGSSWAYGIGTDVTRLRVLQQRTRVAEKLAAVGRLTAGLAHEIKNPLNAAILQLSLLSRLVSRLESEDRGPLEAPIDLVRAELHRLDRLLEDFLGFARPREYRKDQVDLGRLVLETVRLNEERARSSNKVIEANIEDRCLVVGDWHALEQVLVNLINNAFDASKSRISIRVRREGPHAVLLVEDDGPGIPREVMARMFEPFFTTKPNGTGLGTAIVHTILSGHGGQVSYSSPSGGGAIARVDLPLPD